MLVIERCKAVAGRCKLASGRDLIVLEGSSRERWGLVGNCTRPCTLEEVAHSLEVEGRN
jgi:hypothetical protein